MKHLCKSIPSCQKMMLSFMKTVHKEWWLSQVNSPSANLKIFKGDEKSLAVFSKISFQLFNIDMDAAWLIQGISLMPQNCKIFHLLIEKFLRRLDQCPAPLGNFFATPSATPNATSLKCCCCEKIKIYFLPLGWHQIFSGCQNSYCWGELKKISIKNSVEGICLFLLGQIQNRLKRD